jgi:hypothetical protein
MQKPKKHGAKFSVKYGGNATYACISERSAFAAGGK